MIALIMLAPLSAPSVSAAEILRLTEIVEPYASCRRSFDGERQRLAKAWIRARNANEDEEGSNSEADIVKQQYEALNQEILKDCKRSAIKSEISIELNRKNSNLTNEEVEILSERVVFAIRRALDVMAAVETGLSLKPTRLNSDYTEKE